MPILSKDYYADRAFAETTLEPPPGSGPYRVESVDPGHAVVYRRAPDYWGRDLAINRGQNNFDTVRYEYFRDATVLMEAFKAGEYDFRREGISGKQTTRNAFGYSHRGLAQRILRQMRVARRRLDLRVSGQVLFGAEPWPVGLWQCKTLARRSASNNKQP